MEITPCVINCTMYAAVSSRNRRIVCLCLFSAGAVAVGAAAFRTAAGAAGTTARASAAGEVFAAADGESPQHQQVCRQIRRALKARDRHDAEA